MIKLRSGRPGAGKTLATVAEGVELVKQGRKVYALALNGLDYEATGIEPWLWPLSEWKEHLKREDVLIVDEVQQFLPRNMTRMSTPPWVEELTRNRHAGIDMLWTTQDPKNIDVFVRRLINEHLHYVNNNGKDEAVVYRWPVGTDEPEENAHRNKAERTKWKYPTEVYKLYKSAEAHTRTVHTPKPIKVLRWSLAAAAICILIAVVSVMRFSGKASAPSGAPPHVVAKKSGSLSDSLFGDDKKHRILTDGEWAQQFEPRIKGVMWSAPAYDRLGAQSRPEVWCIASDAKCSCLSEQGTDVGMPVSQCRAFAQHGFYNPTRDGREMASTEMRVASRDRPQQLAMADADKWSEIAPDSPPATQQGQQVQDHRWRGLHDAYNPDVFGPKSTQTP